MTRHTRENLDEYRRLDDGAERRLRERDEQLSGLVVGGEDSTVEMPVDEDPDPSCTCVRIDVDLDDARGCPVHGANGGDVCEQEAADMVAYYEHDPFDTELK